MAIDTENKRRSALLRLISPLPVPDSVVGISDRPHIWWHYVGITIAALVPITTPSCRTFTPELEARVFTPRRETRVYAVPEDPRSRTLGCD